MNDYKDTVLITTDMCDKQSFYSAFMRQAGAVKEKNIPSIAEYADSLHQHTDWRFLSGEWQHNNTLQTPHFPIEVMSGCL